MKTTNLPTLEVVTQIREKCCKAKTGRYAILRGIEHGNQFITMYAEGDNPTVSANGEKWYEILGFTNSIREGQIFLFGRAYTDNNF